MKKAKGLIAFLLTAAMCLTAASAHTHIGVVDHGSDVSLTISPWAREEVERAIAAGLFPKELQYTETNLCRPATREIFVHFVMNYVAMQEHFDAYTLAYMVNKDPGRKDEADRGKPVFTDDNGTLTSAAYYLGLVSGRGDGTFDPDGLITRQEAAAMLTRAYQIYGGSISESGDAAVPFTDADQIADWARSSAAALEAWDVMNGTETGDFLPEDTYSIEQCVITFLRLYEKAPVSRLKGNVKPLYTYDQCIDYLDANTKPTGKDGTGIPYYSQTTRVDGAKATYIRQDLDGFPRPAMFLYFIYREGGITRFEEIGLCDEPYFDQLRSIPLEDCSFSEDGETFYCTAILPNEIIRDDVLLHAKGAYRVTIRVDTCDYELQYIG